LEFDDVSEREEVLSEWILLKNGKWGKPVPFTAEMARSTLGFVADHPTDDFIVHCNAGVSRSVAIARVISEETGRQIILNGNVRSDECANGLVLRLLHRELWFDESAKVVENSMSFNEEVD
jgi:hypothetical protein